MKTVPDILLLLKPFVGQGGPAEHQQQLLHGSTGFTIAETHPIAKLLYIKAVKASDAQE